MERVNLLQFLKALLEAEGITLDGQPAERDRCSASHHLSVQANGYTKLNRECGTWVGTWQCYVPTTQLGDRLSAYLANGDPNG